MLIKIKIEDIKDIPFKAIEKFIKGKFRVLVPKDKWKKATIKADVVGDCLVYTCKY